MANRLIAIGDIHGCLGALDTLLNLVVPDATDTLVTLGDYVDRGPDSRGVVERLIQLRGETQLVGILGNHEEMMLSVIRGRESHHEWIRHGGIDTLESYGFDGDLDFLPPEHLEFFESLGDYYETDQYFFTHAAYDPTAPLNLQPQTLLRWHSLHSGIPPAHPNGKTAVVGHTANHDAEVIDVGHLICLDTYCYGGGWLTAMDLGTRQTWQTSNSGRIRYPGRS